MINYFLPARAATIQSLGHPAAGVIGWFDGSTNTSGESVTQSSALTFAAVWCAVRVISETIATLPCMLYRRTSTDGRERATDDDRYWLMTEEPHPLMSAVTFFESQTAQMVLNGNCYSKIVRASGMPARLEPRVPDSVTMLVDGNTVRYSVTDPKENISAEDMLHVAGIGGDGLSGWSVIKYAQQSIGSSIAADKFAGGQWGNGAVPRGILTHPMRLDKSARELIRTEWDEVHRGSSNAGKVAILHGGMGFQTISMNNEDAQFLESRQFSIREIARWFRLPPHMLADLADSSVRANIEQQAIEFIVYSLKPWLARWEQTLNRKLLSKEERRGMYWEFLLESLLRGDSAAQSQAWSVGRQWGWYSVNDIRRMLNMPPVDGGDTYLQPVNMVPADGTDDVEEQSDEREQEEDEDEDEEIPGGVGNEMQQNLVALINATINEAKTLHDHVQQERMDIQQAICSANESLVVNTASLHAIRDEIRQDLVSARKVQIRGWHDGKAGVVDACNSMLRREVRVCSHIERAELIKAAKKVARGNNFLAWMDHWYSDFTQMLTQRIEEIVRCYSSVAEPESELSRALASEYCGLHREQILAVTDGDPRMFCERIQSAMADWDTHIDSLTLREYKDVA